MSGSGGAAGYDFQADAFAFVAAHGLAQQPLHWFDGVSIVPSEFSMETGGPGDDLRVVTADGKTVEIQVKRNLHRGDAYHKAIGTLVAGLRDDPGLLGVLFVDSRASRPIKEDLRIGLTRFGAKREDDIPEIVVEALERITADPAIQQSVARRLAVAVHDLDPGCDGHSAAVALLGGILAPGAKATTAFQVLGKRGHGLTKTRGACTVRELEVVLHEEVGLHNPPSALEFDGRRYLSWVRACHRSFFCAALGVELRVDLAWNRLNEMSNAEGRVEQPELTLDAQIRRYREWERLARSGAEPEGVDAEDLLSVSRLTVILGGPGSGKTTLSRRLAAWSLQRGWAPLRVRLRVVAGAMSSGRSFDEALRTAAFDGSDLSSSEASRVLESPCFLIADGLDECDPSRGPVAHAIVTWAHGHPLSRVCVLTRPVGHSPSLLPEFRHAELLPLDRVSIENYATTFVSSLVTDSSTVKVQVHRFIAEVLEGSDATVASICSRSPLLLSFLVRLHVEGVSLDINRARLCSRIVDLMEGAAQTDRATPELDSTTALIALAGFGWHVTNRPGISTRDLIREVGEELGDGVDSQRLAGQSLSYWTARGLLEQLLFGSQSTVAFIHPLLAEFAAAMHLTALAPEKLVEWVVSHGHVPRWREPLLLASGLGVTDQILNALLDIDQPDDPTSISGPLAAAVFREGRSSVEPDRLLKHLTARLESVVPLAAIEGGIALLQIAPLDPEMLRGIGGALVDHEQVWTRLAAFAVLMEIEADSVPLEHVVNWLRDFNSVNRFCVFRDRPHDLPLEAAVLQQAVLPKALERVLEELPRDDAEALIFRIARRVNLRSFAKVSQIFDEHSVQLPVSEATIEVMRNTFEAVEAWSELWDRASRRILGLIRSACVDAPMGSGVDEELPTLTHLLAILRVEELDGEDWTLLGEESEPGTVIEVLRGVIFVENLDASALKGELAAIPREKEEGFLELLGDRVGLRAAGLDDEGWTLPLEVPFDMSVVFDGIRHPSQIVSCPATGLVAAYPRSSQFGDRARELLWSSSGGVVHRIGAISETFWGEGAVSILVDRLAEDSASGCECLFAHLTRLVSPQSWPAMVETFETALRSPEARFVDKVCAAVCSMPDSYVLQLASAMKKALDYWDKAGGSCVRHDRTGIRGGGCPDCRVIPTTPNARLVEALVRVDYFSIESLYELLGSPWRGVSDVAQAALVRTYESNPTSLEDAIKLLGEAWSPILNPILSMSREFLAKHHLLVLNLVHSSDKRVRLRVASALADGWLPCRLAKEHALLLLESDDPKMRTSAARVLRSLAIDETDRS